MNPQTARSLLQAYVIPRLLYGLEAMVLSQKQIDSLERFFRSTLKQIQSLPDNVANPAPYILMGICPLEATYDKNITSLMAAALSDPCVKQLAENRFATKASRPSSWFIHVQKRLARYSPLLPGECLIQGLNPRKWATSMKRSIDKLWEEVLCDNAATYPSLCYLECQNKLFRQVYPIWGTGGHDLISTQEAIVNARLVTGTYRLEANRAVFNHLAVDPTCPLCHTGVENRAHFLLECQALNDIRTAHLPRIQNYMQKQNHDDDDIIEREVNILLDPSKVMQHDAGRSKRLQEVSILTKRFIYKLHCRRRRLVLLGH